MGSEHYCLRWNNHQSNLLGVFSELLQEESLVDVTLACAEGASIKAHKVVLSACSSYFQSLFLEHQYKYPIVILKDVNISELRALVEFMYKGEVNIEYSQLPSLLRVAETLQVKGLTDMTNQGLFSSASEKEETRHSLCTIDDQSKLTESDDNTARDEPQFESSKAVSSAPKATPPRLREERRKPYEPSDLYECDRSSLLGYYSRNEEIKTKTREQTSECEEVLSEKMCSTSSVKSGKSDSDVHIISQNAIVDPQPGTSGQSMDEVPMESCESSDRRSADVSIYQCMYCGSSFTHQSKLTRHILSHSLESLKFRESMMQHSSSLQEILKHDASSSHYNTPQPSVSGTVSSMDNVDAAAVAAHEAAAAAASMHMDLEFPVGAASSDQPNTVLCKFCGKNFPDVSSLITHLPIHTGDRPFKCEYCGKAFKLRHHMKDHCRVHTGERPFRCSMCGKTFSRSTILKAHEKTHYPKYVRKFLSPSPIDKEEQPQ